MWRGGMTIEIKTPEQIAAMREAGLVVARTLGLLAAAVRPGITTADLDALAEAEIRAVGAIPSFKGYHGYPATICTSVNEEIVHGIPSPRRSLREGDIISIDCGGELFQRDDDSEDTIRHRLEVYAEQTSPLISFYADENILIGIDATGPVEEVTSRALAALRPFVR